jgi:hypothetical protein
MFAVQLSATRMSQLAPNTAQRAGERQIASCFFSALSVNFRVGTPYGFLNVTRKLRRLSSPFHFQLADSYFTGVKPPKTFPSVPDIKVRVFARSSQRRWNCER